MDAVTPVPEGEQAGIGAAAPAPGTPAAHAEMPSPVARSRRPASPSSPRRRPATALTGRPVPAAAWLPLIIAGGMAGTLARAALEGARPAAPGGVPWTTFGINIAGSFLLGALLQGLALSGDDRGPRKALRLGVGTGVIGGFTTYSTFALETGRLVTGVSGARSALWVGLGYAASSVAVGLLAAAAGIGTATAIAHRVRGASGDPAGSSGPVASSDHGGSGEPPGAGAREEATGRAETTRPGRTTRPREDDAARAEGGTRA